MPVSDSPFADAYAFAPKSTEPGAILIGLLGCGIGGSRTPRMHMGEAARLGMTLEYRRIDTGEALDSGDLQSLLTWLAEFGYRGINVTFPYKQAVLPYLSDLSEGAQAVGAVNTVLFQDGGWIGDNTDYWGFRESLRTRLPEAPRDHVLLLGAGGAGAAVAAALLDEGTGHLMIADTDRDRAAGLAARFGTRASVVEDLELAAAQADGIVNATPVGMAKLPGLPLPAGLITPRHWVGDIVYFPLDTALLTHARGLGCQVLAGSGMALFQAVRAFELFTGQRPDPDSMWAAFQGTDRQEVEA